MYLVILSFEIHGKYILTAFVILSFLEKEIQPMWRYGN